MTLLQSFLNDNLTEASLIYFERFIFPAKQVLTDR